MQDPHLLENNYSDNLIGDNLIDMNLIEKIINDVFKEKESGRKSYMYDFNMIVSKQTMHFIINKLRELFPDAVVVAYTIKELNGTVSSESLSIDW